jgi:hypothetical protein
MKISEDDWGNDHRLSQLVSRVSVKTRGVEMKPAKDQDDGGSMALLKIYGQYCLIIGCVGGVTAILSGGLPVLFSVEFVTIWIATDLVLPAGLLMLGAIGAVGLAIRWLVSRCFGDRDTEWFKP